MRPARSLGARARLAAGLVEPVAPRSLHGAGCAFLLVPAACAAIRDRSLRLQELRRTLRAHAKPIERTKAPGLREVGAGRVRQGCLIDPPEHGAIAFSSCSVRRSTRRKARPTRRFCSGAINASARWTRDIALKLGGCTPRPAAAWVTAKEGEAALDPADECLVRLLLQPERAWETARTPPLSAAVLLRRTWSKMARLRPPAMSALTSARGGEADLICSV